MLTTVGQFMGTNPSIRLINTWWFLSDDDGISRIYQVSKEIGAREVCMTNLGILQDKNWALLPQDLQDRNPCRNRIPRKHVFNTSSTAQGGGGSFKNRKPIGEVGCCESEMAERSHWWTERCLRSPLFLSLSLTIYLPASLSSMYLSIYRSISPFLSFISLPIYLSTYLPIYLSVYLSIDLSIYLSIYLSLYLSISLCIYLSLHVSIYLFVCLSVYLSIYGAVSSSLM